MDAPELTVAIAGLGLIGGSLALALKAVGGYRVAGLNRNETVLEQARQAGAVDAVGEAALPCAGVLVLALPPAAAIAFLRRHADRLRPGTIVTDVCGVKRPVMDACLPLCRERGLVFIGGHPMAGKERGGFGNADAGLYRGASWILTPAADTPAEALGTLRRLTLAAGAGTVTITSPERHDEIIAFTSQLPHVLAGAYVRSPRCEERQGFSAGSFRDVSRVAAVDEALWTELFLQNADNLTREIDTMTAHLAELREALAAGDAARVQALLRAAREQKERWG